MPFLLPIGIGAALGAASAGLAGAFGGSLVVGAIVGGGLAAISYLTAPKARDIGSARAESKTLVRSAVVPARWIWGRARVSGVLTFTEEATTTAGERDLHMAIDLSEGACEGIEAIWIDGNKIPMTRTSRGSGLGHLVVPELGNAYDNKIFIYEFFDANGSQGDSLRAVSPTGWDATHKLYNKSWVHVHLRQPNYGADNTSRFWTRRPEIEFLMKGIKFRWPGQSFARWTDNAAAIRYWFKINRRRRPEISIDDASVISAFRLCEEQVTNVLPTGYQDYSSTSKRYTVNGVHYADDDLSVVEAELDFQWAGYAVDADGICYFRPGSDRMVAWTINPDDIVKLEGFAPAPSLQDRFNTATLKLAQSREHDWGEVTLPAFEDTDSVKRDTTALAEAASSSNTVSIAPDGSVTFVGPAPDLSSIPTQKGLSLFADRTRFEVAIVNNALQATSPPSSTHGPTGDWKLGFAMILNKDLGVRPFLADPIAGARLLATNLRRARAFATIPYRIKPGASLERLAMKPTDWVSINEPEHGLSGFQSMITRVVVHPDWSLTVNLIEQPDGVYADTVILPPLKPRDINILDYRNIPVPDNLAASVTALVTQDGSTVITARITWDKAPLPGTDIQFREQGSPDWQYIPGLSGSAVLPNIYASKDYEYRARHVAANGIQSDWSPIETFTTTGDISPPLPPVQVYTIERQGSYTVGWALPLEDDYAGTEVLEGDTLDTAHRIGFIKGDKFDRDFILEPVKVWVRHQDRSKNTSAAVSIDVTPLALPAIDFSIIYTRHPVRPTLPGMTSRGVAPANWFFEAPQGEDPLWYCTGRFQITEFIRSGQVIPRPYQGDTPRERWVWDGPFRWGVEGGDGVDGKGIEYIFRITADNMRPPIPSGGRTQDDFVPFGWTDDAGDVSPDFPFSWRSYRIGTSGAWGDWSDPILERRYAFDGQDGKGWENVFITTADATRPPRPTLTSLELATDDFIPFGWSDNPIGVSEDQPYHWRMLRKGTTGNWQQFSLPTVEGVWIQGHAGSGQETIYIRTALAIAPPAPVTTAAQDKIDGFVPEGYTNNPQGVGPAFPYEWVGVRKGFTGNWEKFNRPTSFAAWDPTAQTAPVTQLSQTVYRRTTTSAPPPTPTGGATDDDFIPPNWTEEAQGISAAFPAEWSSTRTGTTGLWNAWQMPVPHDLASIAVTTEKIYFRTAGAGRPPTPAGGNTIDNFIPTGWTRLPQGTTTSLGYEWESERTGSPGAWSDFSRPGLIDQIPNYTTQYFYRRTNVYERPDTPTGGSSNDNFVPTDWTTDPVGVDAVTRYEWETSRTGYSNNWGGFSQPRIHDQYPLPATVTQTVYRLTATSTPPVRPTGGNTQDNYVPTSWTPLPSGTTINLRFEWKSERTGSPAQWSDWGPVTSHDEYPVSDFSIGPNTTRTWVREGGTWTPSSLSYTHVQEIRNGGVLVVTARFTVTVNSSSGNISVTSVGATGTSYSVVGRNTPNVSVTVRHVSGVESTSNFVATILS